MISKAEGSNGDSLLVYTGQPVIDVGVATAVAFGGHAGPEDVTADDLDDIVNYIEEHYTKAPFKSFLTSIYPNSAYVNPTMGAEKRKATMSHFLRGYTTHPTGSSTRCSFCGRDAYEVVFRQHVPLSAGEGVINFGPNGRTGLPVCGGCMVASQAFPLGSAIKCEGRALLVHSDNPMLTQAFAADFLAENRRVLSLAEATDEKISYPRTIVVSRLLQIRDEQDISSDLSGSLTAYHLTNYGQNPDLAIYHLSSDSVSFLVTVQGEMYRRSWQAVVARGWVKPRQAKEAKRPQGGEETQPALEQNSTKTIGARRNRVYEDLFTVQENPKWFLRRHLLRGAIATEDNGADTDAQRLGNVSWVLTELFLRKVLGMEKYRIEAIGRCGERLAEAIESNNDSHLLRDLYVAKPYGRLRMVLVKASAAQVRIGKPPICTFEDFITIFEIGDDLARVDWSLARDLIYMRVLDALYSNGWFTRNATAATEVLQEIELAAEPQEEVAAASA